MPQPTKGARLGGSPAHQRHILANLATSLFEHGKISTTEAKAKRLRPYAERLISKAKFGDLHNRREIQKLIRDKTVVHRLIAEIGPFFADRHGGYTRITKTLPRKGDNAPMAVIELVSQKTVTDEANRARRASASQKESAQKESAQQESAQKESAQKESAQQESAQQESAQQESAQQESAQQESAQKESAQQESAQQAAAAPAAEEASEKALDAAAEAPEGSATQEKALDAAEVAEGAASSAQAAGAASSAQAAGAASSAQVAGAVASASGAPYGEGSHAPLADAQEAPEGFEIKGNADSMLYHLPGTSFYDRTAAEVWFASAEAAEAAGFALPSSQQEKAPSSEDGS